MGGVRIGRGKAVHAEALDELDSVTLCGKGADMVAGTGEAVDCKSCLKALVKIEAQREAELSRVTVMEIGPRDTVTVDELESSTLVTWHRDINGSRFQFHKVTERRTGRVMLVSLNCSNPSAPIHVIEVRQPIPALIPTTIVDLRSKRGLRKIKESKVSRSRYLSRVGR